MKASDIEILRLLFKEYSGQDAESVEEISPSGSHRQYIRLRQGKVSVIGCFNDNVKENQAFFHFSGVFQKQGLNVPEIFITAGDGKYYLLQDLGDQSLFDLLMENENGFTGEILSFYRQSLSDLVDFQMIKGIDYGYAYPRAAFDRRAVIWDLNYFKYYFLKMKIAGFDEDGLEDDFQTLAGDIQDVESNFFMYRDFQARNIMIHGGQPWFIDYQGGRKGPLQYDVVSLLFQAKARMPAAVKEGLLDFYSEILTEKTGISKDKFMAGFEPVLLIRLLQVLGAYGFRGMIERRPHFIESLSLGIENIRFYLNNYGYIRKLPVLKSLLKEIVEQ